MEIYQLLDELEKLVDQSKRIWATDKRLVNEDAFFMKINQLRTSLPTEIKTAGDIVARAEEIIQNAESEAERKVTESREQTERLLADARATQERMLLENEITKQAQARAHEIVQQAKAEGQQVRSAADAYALEVLSRLENMTAKITTAVQTGKQQLNPGQ